MALWVFLSNWRHWLRFQSKTRFQKHNHWAVILLIRKSSRSPTLPIANLTSKMSLWATYSSIWQSKTLIFSTNLVATQLNKKSKIAFFLETVLPRLPIIQFHLLKCQTKNLRFQVSPYLSWMTRLSQRLCPSMAKSCNSQSWWPLFGSLAFLPISLFSLFSSQGAINVQSR